MKTENWGYHIEEYAGYFYIYYHWEEHRTKGLLWWKSVEIKRYKDRTGINGNAFHDGFTLFTGEEIAPNPKLPAFESLTAAREQIKKFNDNTIIHYP